ncbi:transforming growth factor-beta-induced protein ig-h3-like [Dreissena polymorpha]|uniref:FAS1 domain-containing protein n=1 Tax=Dreissena polymorpha TaxID=45954 RepID=A0A9D4QLA5_DREPO|nr:transforming growth factor-beta-induced protein ig-h3-like [Dreissena polymorpha]KAH3835363.1 hypothetical protein DPMN_108712 [Dreissena polymorpha]
MFRSVLCIFALILRVSLAYEDKTIVQYLADNGYTSLSRNLQSQGLNTPLSGTGPFTIFAPTDAAFAKLGNKTFSSAQLTNILKYHVVTDYLIIPMIKTPSNLTTLEGQDLMVQPIPGTLLLNNASRVITGNNDIICNNGVVHPIDTVLVPPELPTYTIAQVLLNDSRFADLNIALLIAGMTNILQSGDFTLFAPVNTAFATYQGSVLSPETPNAIAIYQAVLKYHVTPGGRRATQLKNNQALFTLHGVNLNITVNNGVTVNSVARVIDSDILCSNGIIHAVDHLLIPPDINQVASGNMP